MGWFRKSKAVRPPEVEAPEPTCRRCGVGLVPEADAAQGSGGGPTVLFGNPFEIAEELEAKRNAVGVACAVCDATFCVACMEQHGKPHALRGGMACLECGGYMTHFSPDGPSDRSDREVLGVLVLSRDPLAQTDAVAITQMVLDEQRSLGHAVASNGVYQHQVAGDELGNEMYRTAAILGAFGAERVEGTNVLQVNYDSEEYGSGVFYVLYGAAAS